jgi:hypothetical protein
MWESTNIVRRVIQMNIKNLQMQLHGIYSLYMTL